VCARGNAEPAETKLQQLLNFDLIEESRTARIASQGTYFLRLGRGRSPQANPPPATALRLSRQAGIGGCRPGLRRRPQIVELGHDRHRFDMVQAELLFGAGQSRR
jgi:hypothetical protein